MRIPIVLAAAAVLTLASCSDQPQTIAATSGGQTVDSTPTTEPGTAPIDNTPNESTIPGTRPPEDVQELPELSQGGGLSGATSTTQAEIIEPEITLPDEVPPTVPTEAAWQDHPSAPMLLTVEDLAVLGGWTWDEPRIDVSEGAPANPDDVVCGEQIGAEPPSLSVSIEAEDADPMVLGLQFEQVVAQGDRAGLWIDVFQSMLDCPNLEPELLMDDVVELDLDIPGSDRSVVAAGAVDSIGVEMSIIFAFADYGDTTIGILLAQGANASVDPEHVVDLVAVSAGRRP